MVKVKICGITRLKDALSAIAAGADALGFVFHSASPRHILPEQAAEIIRQLPPFIQTVGLFVDEELETVNTTADQCNLDIVQLHGIEAPSYCNSVSRRVIKAFRIKDDSSLDSIDNYRVSSFLLDAWSPIAHGGTGTTFNWEIAARAAASHTIILAGGLTPVNVADAVSTVNPYAVDVSSGVESEPGIKDGVMIRAFVSAAKQRLSNDRPLIP
jgi:phosphoribosylanthranilate isomerase